MLFGNLSKLHEWSLEFSQQIPPPAVQTQVKILSLDADFLGKCKSFIQFLSVPKP